MDKIIENTSLETIGFMFVILIGVCVVCLIIIAVAKSARDNANNAQPLRCELAQVVEKQQLPANTIMSLSEMWVLFELEDGQRIRLIVKATNDLVVGDTGYLTWQGKAMRSFDRKVH